MQASSYDAVPTPERRRVEDTLDLLSDVLCRADGVHVEILRDGLRRRREIGSLFLFATELRNQADALARTADEITSALASSFLDERAA